MVSRYSFLSTGELFPADETADYFEGNPHEITTLQKLEEQALFRLRATRAHGYIADNFAHFQEMKLRKIRKSDDLQDAMEESGLVLTRTLTQEGEDAVTRSDSDSHGSDSDGGSISVYSENSCNEFDSDRPDMQDPYRLPRYKAGRDEDNNIIRPVERDDEEMGLPEGQELYSENDSASSGLDSVFYMTESTDEGDIFATEGLSAGSDHYSSESASEFNKRKVYTSRAGYVTSDGLFFSSDEEVQVVPPPGSYTKWERKRKGEYSKDGMKDRPVKPVTMWDANSHIPSDGDTDLSETEAPPHGKAPYPGWQDPQFEDDVEFITAMEPKKAAAMIEKFILPSDVANVILRIENEGKKLEVIRNLTNPGRCSL